MGTCWKGDIFWFFGSFFCKSYVLARTWLVFGSLKTKILISRCFWKHFGAVGTVFVRSFSWLHVGRQTRWLHFLMVFSRSLWGLAFGAWLHFLITEEENLDFALFLFLSICEPCDFSEQDFFLFFFRRFCNSPIVMSIRRVGHILLACFGHARRKSWFRIVFYSILQLWGISSKGVICSHFWVFLCELCVLVTQTENLDFAMFFKYFWAVSMFRNNVSLYFFFCNTFMSWSACGLHSLHECFFESLKTKTLMSQCFLHHFCAVGGCRNNVFHTFFHFFCKFQVLLQNLGLDHHMACIRAWLAFFGHPRRKSWFRIVCYSIFELWAPVETISFLDFSSAFFANVMSWLACCFFGHVPPVLRTDCICLVAVYTYGRQRLPGALLGGLGE